MNVAQVEIQHYRSVRRLVMPLRRLNVFIGENGVGKTNLYRGLELIQAAAAGTLTRELAAEGGMDSATWSGQRQPNKPVRIGLGVSLAPDNDDTGAYAYNATVGLVQQYRVDVGMRAPVGAAFLLEPQIKEERLTFHAGKRREILLERKGPAGHARDEEGVRHELKEQLLASETALAVLQDPSRYPDLHQVRRTLLAWRFYHSFRIDRDSALRRPCLAVTSPTLDSDGASLAAVFATLAHIRQDTTDLDTVVADAFPGAKLIVPPPDRTATFALRYPEFPQREFEAAELSDGTLRFLALAGALLGYRLPPFIALNEPETSLHPDLLPPLARLIAKAAERAQIWVVTHSSILADALEDAAGARARHVVKKDGETQIEGMTLSGTFRDEDDD
jgi:predicted ATPase